MKWNVIKNEKDIEELMTLFHAFHDSGIKELKYTSGAYVSDDRVMFPYNKNSDLSIIFQSQTAEIPTIEVVFHGINKFNLRPEDPQMYTCEIFEANIEKIGEFYYWSNEPGPFDPLSYSDEVTWVSRKSIEWRVISDDLGSND